MTRLTAHSTHSLLPLYNVCPCVTFTLFHSSPGYTGWVWVGGRESVIDPDADTGVWVWDHSEDHIDLGVWRTGHPNGPTTHDHVHLTSDRLSDYIGSHNSYFLCETDVSMLVC